MDVSKFAVEPTGRLALLGADDEPLKDDEGKELAIVFYGPGSDEYAKAQSAQNNQIVNRLKKKGKTDQTPEQKKEQDAQFLAACTQSFENIEYKDLEGFKLYKGVFLDRSLGFIADQASKYLSDWANFTNPSASNSTSTSDS